MTLSQPAPGTRDPDGDSLASLSATERVLLWMDLMDTCEKLLFANLQRRARSEEELRERYRKVHRRQHEEHEQGLFRLLERLDQAQKR